MSIIRFSNNAASTLAGSISNVATTCNLAPGTGVLFPNPSVGQYFVMTLIDAVTKLLREVVHVTVRSGDALTVVRAQEGTTALSWTAGDIAANLNTKGTMEAMAQLAATPGRLLGTLAVTSNGAVALPAGTNRILVEGVGAGGGGGAADVTAVGEFAPGPGGGSGGWGKVEVASGLTSLVATIGVGGAGGVIGISSGNGAAGTVTTLVGTFGSITFPGALGGLGVTGIVPPGAVGGGGAGALASQSGGTALYLAGGDAGGIGQAFSPGNGFSGSGANSSYGTGGGEAGTSSSGATATGKGAGGSGGMNLQSEVVARAGGAGAPGLLLISCYS